MGVCGRGGDIAPAALYFFPALLSRLPAMFFACIHAFTVLEKTKQSCSLTHLWSLCYLLFLWNMDISIINIKSELKLDFKIIRMAPTEAPARQPFSCYQTQETHSILTGDYM